MSEQSKKRPWLQYHLSTAVVLTFVAAGMLCLNCYLGDGMSGDYARIIVRECHWYGWPVGCIRTQQFVQDQAQTLQWRCNVFWDALCIDLAVASAVLVSTGIALEYFIRREDDELNDALRRFRRERRP